MAFEMQNTLLLFTRIMFNDFFAWHAHRLKFWDSFWTINHPTTLDFCFLLFYFRFKFSFSLLPIFLLLFYQASFEWKSFRESVNEARSTYHGQAKGGKGKCSSEFFTKLLKCFGTYFKLHQLNQAGLGIVEKVLSCSTI